MALRDANRLLWVPTEPRGVNIHICNLAAQTGASLFLHEHAAPYLANTTSPDWSYDKTEGMVDMGQFTHAIVENLASVDGWKVDTVVEAFNGVTKRGLRYAPALWIVSQADTP